MLNKAENARIAKNTLFMYLRMFILMLVSFYTSRIILQNLGISDFGIYNVVGGIVVVFSFINGVMTSSTTRFISYAIGEGQQKSIDKIFSTTLFLHIALSIIVVLLTETLGLWYLNSYMNIPSERLQIAKFVLHFSVINSVFLIVRVPFNSLIVAHERMNIYAYLSIFEVLMKLVIAISLTYLLYDRLFVYAFLNALLGLFVFLLYFIYCRYSSLINKIVIHVDRIVVKSILSYCSWSLMSSFAGVGNTQGLNILLNYFFGPVVNAAYGITVQVQNGINTLSLGFQSALNPQITKSYASGDIMRHKTLIYASVKYSGFLIFLMALPIYFNLEDILKFWLGEYPYETILFLKITIITSIVSCLGNPLGVCIEATGEIAKFSLYTSIINIMVPFVSFAVLSITKESYYVFLFVLVATLLVQCTKMIYCSKLVGLSLYTLFKHSLLPIAYVLFPTLLVGIILSTYINLFIARLLLMMMLLTVMIFFLGLNNKERLLITSYLNKLYKKNP